MMTQATEFAIRSEEPVWQPAGEVVAHAGTPLEPNMEFFIAPPADIGVVVTAYSTLALDKQPMSQGMRFGICGGIVAAALIMAIVMSSMVGSNGGEFVGGMIFLLGFVIAVAVFFMMGFKHVCSYVGQLGAARFTLTGSRDGSIKEEILRFEDAADLLSGETRNYYNGVYTGTSYNYRWVDADGTNVLVLNGSYKDKNGTPKPKDPYHFASSAEAAWNNFLVDAMQMELDDVGFVQFKVNKNDTVRVGPGFMEFCFKGQSQRVEVADIKDLSIDSGTFTIKTHDASWFGSKGKFKFNYAAMGNAQLFVFSLQQLLGFEFE